ncbi:hypothetical protein ACFLS1_01870 [Verrucomicrobiota bacterium]
MKRLLLDVLIAGFVFLLVVGTAVAKEKSKKEKPKEDKPLVTAVGVVTKDSKGMFWVVNDWGNFARLRAKYGKGEEAVNTEDLLGMRVVVTGTAMGDAKIDEKSIRWLGVKSIRKVDEKEAKNAAPSVIGKITKEKGTFYLVDEKGRKVRLTKRIGKREEAVNTEDFLDKRVLAVGEGDISGDSLEKFKVKKMYMLKLP